MKELLKKLEGKNYEEGKEIIKAEIKINQEYQNTEKNLIDSYLMIDLENWFCYTTDKNENNGYWAYMLDGDHVTNVKK
jgi:hypothetical protein